MAFRKVVPGSVPVIKNDLVFDTKPKAGSTNPVTSEGVNKAIGDVDKALFGVGGGKTISGDVSDYEAGKYYQISGTLALCTEVSDSQAKFILVPLHEALNDILSKIPE